MSDKKDSEVKVTPSPNTANYTSTLQALTKNSVIMDSIIDRYLDPPSERPYKWRYVKAELLNTHEYKGFTIKEQRVYWSPPEKELKTERFIFPINTKPPSRLDDNNSRIDFDVKQHDPYLGHNFSHTTLDDAKAAVDLAISRRKLAEDNKAIIGVLKAMPCSCGEYGDMDDDEYLTTALEIKEAMNENRARKDI
jgi:hypothetical protein